MMKPDDKNRIQQIANDSGFSTQAIENALGKLGISYKNRRTKLSDEDRIRLLTYLKEHSSEPEFADDTESDAHLQVPEQSMIKLQTGLSDLTQDEALNYAAVDGGNKGEDIPSVEVPENELQAQAEEPIHIIAADEIDEILPVNDEHVCDLNGIQWNDHRAAIISCCTDFARESANTEMLRPSAGTDGEHDAITSDRFLFDIINCRVSDLSGGAKDYPMPFYVCIDKIQQLCNVRGLYREPLISPYSLFCESGDVNERRSVLKNSIRDAIGKNPVKPDELLCLMPESADDFYRDFRVQLFYEDIPFFQIPRSIALAYTIKAEQGYIPRSFRCLDYDGEDLCSIVIECDKSENGDEIPVRYNRERIVGEHLSYRKLAEEYLSQYQEKYQISLSDKARAQLIDTKMLQHLLLDKGKQVMLDNEDGVVAVHADTEIITNLQALLKKDIGSIPNPQKVSVFTLCGMFKSTNEKIYDSRRLVRGCHELIQRRRDRKTLWYEYLPELALEVNAEGTFRTIKLINKENIRQKITYYGEAVSIPVEKEITLPANEKFCSLPLTRTLYGQFNKEKLARFNFPEPLKADTAVHLTVHYKYGDIDSYKLIAHSDDSNQDYESEWCDVGQMSNKPPLFEEKEYPKDEDELMRVVDGFKKLDDKVNGLTKPCRYDKDTTYGDYNDRSKYLYELNYAGFPYIGVQNYFKKYTKEVSTSVLTLDDLADMGIFTLVADILNDRKPKHDLESQGRYVLKRNLAEIACRFGTLYSLSDDELRSSRGIKNDVEEILRFFRKSDWRELKYWAPLTTGVSLRKDPYRIWNTFSEMLIDATPDDHKKQGQYLRTLSGVCYKSENWIYDLYNGKNGQENIAHLVRVITNWLKKECDTDLAHPSANYNRLRLRDVLELLLCICLLKTDKPNDILDCNDPNTKDLVKRLKQIDKIMHDMQEIGDFKKKWESETRLGYESPPAYRNVNPVIYALIETLTGGEQIRLVGFKDK